MTRKPHRTFTVTLLLLMLSGCAWQDEEYIYEFCYTEVWGRADSDEDVFIISRVFYANKYRAHCNKFGDFVYDKYDLDHMPSERLFYEEADAIAYRKEIIEEHRELGYRILHYADSTFE